ncbi:MAG: class I SAM-dependent methyltransferase [Gammaproteobacteria bacterium]|nr:class I SAM-dependent methyltransferase [Gammaproteobacteria bacterium]
MLPDAREAVESFGDEWNYFDFIDFKQNWLIHTIANTFGSTDAFKGRVVVDAGAGSGSQSRWIAEADARLVIALELSHSVDGVMRKNLDGLDNVEIVQCSIDQPPIRDAAIDGIVMCHNVIQHTPSVEKTARALWRLVAPGGEFVFNCYPKNDLGLVRKLRLQVYGLLRAIISRLPFGARLGYAKAMGALRFVPLLGWLLEKSFFMVRGDVPKGPDYFRRAYKSGVLNTFDCYGAHAYQHLKTDAEIRALVGELQPDQDKVGNMDRYFLRPQPIGIALRLRR